MSERQISSKLASSAKQELLLSDDKAVFNIEIETAKYSAILLTIEKP
jgi:hypothetical protein